MEIQSTRTAVSLRSVYASLVPLLLLAVSAPRDVDANNAYDAVTPHPPDPKPDELKEVCHLENFNASCPHGHVIMMQQAHYGRMRVGRCLTTSYFVGCFADVLPFTDAKCTGKRSCKISVLDPDLVKFQPCRKDLMAYLEASYKCVKVPDWSGSECVKSGKMKVQGPEGDLSFKIGHSMPIGTISCPWQVEVELGQKIKFDLFSFLPWQDGGAHIDRTGDQCKYSLVFVEGSRQTEVSLCEARERIDHIYTSQRSMVQVYLKTNRMVAYHGVLNTIMLHYRAEGCPDLKQIPGAVIEHKDSTVRVKCRASQETWHLVCRDNLWIGEIRNCSKPSLSAESAAAAVDNLENKLHYGIIIAVAIGLVLGILIGSVLLLVLMMQRKRRRTHRKGSRDSSTTDSDLSQSTCIYGFTGGIDKGGYSPAALEKSVYAPFIPKASDILEINECEKENEVNEIYSTSNNNNNTNNKNSNTSGALTSFHLPNDLPAPPDVIFSPRLQRAGSGAYRSSVSGLNCSNAVYQSTTELCTCSNNSATTTAVVGLPSARASLYSLYSTFGGPNRHTESVLICPTSASVYDKVSAQPEEKKVVPL